MAENKKEAPLKEVAKEEPKAKAEKKEPKVVPAPVPQLSPEQQFAEDLRENQKKINQCSQIIQANCSNMMNDCGAVLNSPSMMENPDWIRKVMEASREYSKGVEKASMDLVAAQSERKEIIEKIKKHRDENAG